MTNKLNTLATLTLALAFAIGGTITLNGATLNQAEKDRRTAIATEQKSNLDSAATQKKTATDTEASNRKAAIDKNGPADATQQKAVVDEWAKNQKALVDAENKGRKDQIDNDLAVAIKVIDAGTSAPAPGSSPTPAPSKTGAARTTSNTNNANGEIDPIFQSFLLGVGQACEQDHKEWVKLLRSPKAGTSKLVAEAVIGCITSKVEVDTDSIKDEVFGDDRFTTLEKTVTDTTTALNTLSQSLESHKSAMHNGSNGLDAAGVRGVVTQEISGVRADVTKLRTDHTTLSTKVGEVDQRVTDTQGALKNRGPRGLKSSLHKGCTWGQISAGTCK